MLVAHTAHDNAVTENVNILRTECLQSAQDLSRRLEKIRALTRSSTADAPASSAVRAAADAAAASAAASAAAIASNAVRLELGRMRELLTAEQAASALFLHRADAHAAQLEGLRAFSAEAVAGLRTKLDSVAAAVDHIRAAAAAARPAPPRGVRELERAKPDAGLGAGALDSVGHLQLSWSGQVVYVV